MVYSHQPFSRRHLLTSLLLADILNYALTLEHLEATFYEEGMKNYTMEDFMNAGMPASFYTNLQSVASDEKTHEEFLTKALTGSFHQATISCRVTNECCSCRG